MFQLAGFLSFAYCLASLGSGGGWLCSVCKHKLQVLRNILVDLEVHRATEYRLHDLRRGHALDLQQSGAPLYEILAAGEWRSPAFLDYLDKNQLETDMVVQAHCAESDDDGGF